MIVEAHLQDEARRRTVIREARVLRITPEMVLQLLGLAERLQQLVAINIVTVEK